LPVSFRFRNSPETGRGLALLQAQARLRARAARTIDALWDAIGDICDLYSPTECSNYFAASGYYPN
ncbi:MAG TPA: hypothetical protein VGC27_07975, partial [Rhizomicrobium sp.]